ncbi:MAG: Kinase A inhibitor [Flavobacterium sp. SCGC AAA160-P02]|nr:MAG: Kinase A inhibitor [Flavobacterium sp. SCGC AAA160-P02]
MNFELTYKPYGDAAILIEWPAKIDELIILDIVAFEKKIQKEIPVLETIIAYNSLLIRYRETISNINIQRKKLKELYLLHVNKEKQSQVLWQIPVCYDLSFGLDLVNLAKEKQLSVEQIITLHSERSYFVYFIGFQPGFLYLGGLNPTIHIARKSTPRLRVDKGSVGIGGGQTGIYPQHSSGGWNLIGKSPIDFFDIQKESPCFAKTGDRIQFFPIELETFYSIEKEVAAGSYTIKNKRL